MHYELNKWVHANCALWTQSVFENMEGGLVRFSASYQKSINNECDCCTKKGASLLCYKFKVCKRKFHLNCAIKAKCIFLRDKNVICRSCLVSGNTTDINFSNVLKDFQSERRLYIVDSQATNEKDSNKKQKSQLHLQEKCVPFYPGAFHRFGSLIILNLCKYELSNADGNKGFDEYLILKRVYDEKNKERKLILFLFYQNKRQYFINSKIMNSKDLITFFENKSLKNTKSMELETKTNKIVDIFGLFQNTEINQFFVEFYQKSLRIEDVLILWEIIAEKTFLSLNSIPTDYIIDFISKFIGLNNTNIKRWLKYPIDSLQMFRRSFQNLSFLQNFYLKNLDDHNPFEKQKIVESIYNDMNAENVYLPNTKSEKTSCVNPKNMPLKTNIKMKTIKENKRKISDNSVLPDFNIKIDELIDEPKINQEGFHILPFKIQTEKEFEKKLKQEYILYKKRITKGVLVAPSNIHKYGLFATNKYFFLNINYYLFEIIALSFKKHEVIIEYVGEIVRNVIADKREEIYKVKGFGDCYMFRIDKDFVVDATFNGNQARYLNHSCNVVIFLRFYNIIFLSIFFSLVFLKFIFNFSNLQFL